MQAARAMSHRHGRHGIVYTMSAAPCLQLLRSGSSRRMHSATRVRRTSAHEVLSHASKLEHHLATNTVGC